MRFPVGGIGAAPMKFWKKNKVDYTYSESDTGKAGQAGVDKSGRRYDTRVATDKPSLRRRLGVTILFRYIFFELFPSFIVSELFFTFVYLIKGIQEAVEKIVNKGLPAAEVLPVIGNLILKALPLTTPMAILMAAIIVAGRYSADSEFTAMRAAGVSYAKIFRPFFLFGVLLFGLVFYLANYISPLSFRKIDAFELFVKTYNPIAVITPGEFVGSENESAGGSRKIYVGHRDKETAKLRNIHIREIRTRGPKTYLSQLIVARRGREIAKIDQFGKYNKAIRLFEGFILNFNPRNVATEITDFRDGTMDIFLEQTRKRSPKFKPREPAHFNFQDLLAKRRNLINYKRKKFGKKIRNLKRDRRDIKKKIKAFQAEERKLAGIPPGPKLVAARQNLNAKWQNFSPSAGKGTLKKINKRLSKYRHWRKRAGWRYTYELHQRLSYSVFSLIFALIGLPLGLVTNRSGRGMGFVAAIILIVIYVSSFNFGQRMVQNEVIDPDIGPWLGVFLVSGLAVYYTYVRTTGRGIRETISSYLYARRLQKESLPADK